MKPCLWALLLILWPAALLADRVALVIGNSGYRSVAELDNPRNDASTVAVALRQHGFRVLPGIDLTRVEMRDKLREFRDMADGADVALVYYAGHGIEIAGSNFLVPIDARLEDERDAGLEMVEVDLILRQISGARQLKMVVLDACRNNPFVTKMKRENAGRNVGRGLGRINYAEADTLIAYAAAAGEITPDGAPGGNSPFTEAFVNAMAGPPTDVRRLLGRVRDELRKTVPGAAPFVYTSLGGGEFVINPGRAAREPAATPQAPTEAGQGAAAAPGQSISRDFIRIDRNGSLQAWNDFLIQYEAQSDHPLYAFALEKRAALQNRALTLVEPEPEAPAPSDVPTASLRNFDEAARAVQSLLKERKCYLGAIDGILGRNSQAAMARFAELAGVAVAVDRSSDVVQLEAAIAALERHPGIACPVPKVVRKPAPRRQTARPSRPTAKSAPAPAPMPAPEPKQPAESLTRRDPTKLVPYGPSDCVGSRAKFYDCD